MNKSLNIIYFAWVKEKLGRDQETVEISGDVTTLLELIEELKQRSTAHADVLSNIKKLRFALDQNFAGLETPIGDAKELAIFPPVTGG